MRSLSEIDTISKRASRAKGFSWGVSEEIGKCVKHLELFGLPGIKNLNQYLKIYDQNKFQQIKLITKSNISENKFYCPISSGIGFLDQIKSLEKLNSVKFNKIAYPILFLSFASRASEVLGKKILLKLDEKEFKKTPSSPDTMRFNVQRLKTWEDKNKEKEEEDIDE